MRARLAVLVLCAGAIAAAGSAVAQPIVPLHEQTVTKSLAGPIHSVVINNDQGSIQIVAGTRSSLRAHEAWNFTQPDVKVSLSRGVLTVTTDCKEQMSVAAGVYVDGFNDCSTDLSLTLPSSLDLKVATYGNIAVGGVSGSLRLRSSFGDVAVRAVRSGVVDASSAYGGVQAQDINSYLVKLETANGAVTATNITARAVVLHSGYGNVVAHQIHTPTLSISSDDGDLTADAISARSIDERTGYGTATLQNSDAATITVESANGDTALALIDATTINAHTKYGTVALSDVRASTLSGHSDNGDVRAALLSAPKSVSLTTAYGSVRLTVPHGHYAITATSGSGSILISGVIEDPHSPRTLSLHSDNGDVSLSGA